MSTYTEIVYHELDQARAKIKELEETIEALTRTIVINRMKIEALGNLKSSNPPNDEL